MTTGLRYHVANSVATITLDRPERKNSFTFEMVDAWADALEAAETDTSVRVVVLTGAGTAFCSGVDLAVFDAVADEPLARRLMLTQHVHTVASAAQRLSKPLIAAINGVAVGAGLDMALMCDVKFAAASARLSEGYIRAGLVPGDGGCWLLPRLVGPNKAMELLMTGDFIAADEAHRIGIVERVYPDEELLSATYAFAQELCERAPLALAAIKRAVRQAPMTDLPTALDAMASHLAVIMSTDDYRRGREAVRDGVSPNFVGR